MLCKFASVCICMCIPMPETLSHQVIASRLCFSLFRRFSAESLRDALEDHVSWRNYSDLCQTHWNLYSTACKLIEHAFFSVSPTVFFVHKIARISVSWRRSFLFASAPCLQHWNSWDPSFGRCARLQEIHGICLRGRIMVSVRMVVWSCGMMAFW